MYMCLYSNYTHIFSCLRGLVPVYNSVAKRDLIEALREKADGTTKVPMKTEFSCVTLQVISEVSRVLLLPVSVTMMTL